MKTKISTSVSNNVVGFGQVAIIVSNIFKHALSFKKIVYAYNLLVAKN